MVAATVNGGSSTGSSDNSGWWLSGLIICAFVFTDFYSGSGTSPAQKSPEDPVIVKNDPPVAQSQGGSKSFDLKRPDVGLGDKLLSLEEARWCIFAAARYKAWEDYDKRDYSIRLLNAYRRDHAKRCDGRGVDKFFGEIKPELVARYDDIVRLTPEAVQRVVTSLQLRLSEQGFDPGALDGRIGPSTISALQLFKDAKGLLTDDAALDELLALTRLVQ
jgi:hypothetical protein